MTNPEVLELVADRCATLDLLSTLLRGEPDPAVIGPLLEALAKEPWDAATASTGQSVLRDFALQNRELSPEQITKDLATEYVAMFFASWRRVVAPYESVYRSSDKVLYQEPSRQLAMLYAVEGLQTEAGFNEPPDHIALELAFLAYMARQMLAALSDGKPRLARAWLGKQQTFLDEHLLTWGADFCRDLARLTQSDFYRGVAELTAEFLQAEPTLLAEIDELLAADGERA